MLVEETMWVSIGMEGGGDLQVVEEEVDGTGWSEIIGNRNRIMVVSK